MATVIPSLSNHLPVLPALRPIAESEYSKILQIQQSYEGQHIRSAAIVARAGYHRIEAMVDHVQPECTEWFTVIFQRKLLATVDSLQAHQLSPLETTPMPLQADDVKFAIETAQLSVRFNDEPFLTYAQQHVFGLGVGPRKRACLAGYLHPYPVNPQSPRPRDRLSNILSKDDPVLYVRQTVLDKTTIRRKKSPQANARPVLQLSAIDESRLAAASFSCWWRIQLDWDELAERSVMRRASRSWPM